MAPGVYADLILPRHIQQVVQPPAADEVLSGNFSRIVIQRQLIYFLDTRLVKVATDIFVHRNRIIMAVSPLLSFLNSIGRKDQNCAEQEHCREH